MTKTVQDKVQEIVTSVATTEDQSMAPNSSSMLQSGWWYRPEEVPGYQVAQQYPSCHLLFYYML